MNRTSAGTPKLSTQRQALSVWELPKLLRSVHRYRKPNRKTSFVRAHFQAMLAFVHRNRFAVASQIRRRFAKYLKSDRTTRRHLAEMESLGLLGVVDTNNVSPLWPKVYFVTRRGLREIKQALKQQGKDWSETVCDRSRTQGHSAQHVLHELFITEFLLMVWETGQANGDAQILTIQRRALAKHQAFQIVVGGRPTQVAKHLGRRGAFVYQARYPFGAEVLKDNALSTPSTDLDGNCIEGVTHGVPVSLVLSKQLEVYLHGRRRFRDGTNIRRADHPTTLRILRPGEVFGTFETVERLIDLTRLTSGSWEVCAGSRSALLIYPFNSKTPYKQLEELMKVKPRTLGGPLRAWLWHLMAGLSVGSGWAAETIVFPMQWELKNKSDLWRDYISKDAWLRMRQDKDNELYKTSLLTRLPDIRIPCKELPEDEWFSLLDEVHEKERPLAARIMQVLGAVAAQHAPSYVPYS